MEIIDEVMRMYFLARGLALINGSALLRVEKDGSIKLVEEKE